MKKRALLSTGNPELIVQECSRLAKNGWEFVATRETVEELSKNKIEAMDVAAFVGVDYSYGIPPTLHPKMEKALTDQCDYSIDLVYDVPYGLDKGIDVGGRTLLALGIKGNRLVANSPETLNVIVNALEQGASETDIAKQKTTEQALSEITLHYAALLKSQNSDCDFSMFRKLQDCAEGENPYQRCQMHEVISPRQSDNSWNWKQISGTNPCYTNTIDIANVILAMEKAKLAFQKNRGKMPFISIAAKHGNPCGIGIDWNNPLNSLNKALWGNAQAVWGGEFVCNFPVSEDIAGSLYKSEKREEELDSPYWMLDIVAVPSFDDAAIEILGKRNQRKLIASSCLEHINELPSGCELRWFPGRLLKQDFNDYIIDFNENESSSEISEHLIDDMIIAWVNSYVSFHGGNEVSIAKDGMLIGAGGGPSTLMAAQNAVLWSQKCKHSVNKAVFSADAFFPYRDAPLELLHAGCAWGVFPGGGKNFQDIISLFNEWNIGYSIIPEKYRGFCRH